MTRLAANLFLVILMFAAAPFAYGQFQQDVFRQYSNVVVKNGPKEMRLAWSGGVNNPQFAMADLNMDGRPDLVIFEKSVFKLKTLIAQPGGGYKHDPAYEGNFPAYVAFYIKFADFNRDGIADFVHYGFSGVEICFGYYENSMLKFKPGRNLRYDTKSFSGWTQVFVSQGDIPVMEDIDKDGDVDVLAYYLGGILIQQYNNCTIEDGLPQDSVRMCVKSECWGHTAQNFGNSGLALGVNCGYRGVTCKGCTPYAAKPTDGPNSMCVIDMDNDGDWDLLNASHNSNNIVYLENGKNIYGKDTMIAQNTVWEANGVPMSVADFPAAFYLNIDQEGEKDLIFSPTTINTENYNSIVLYKNTGTGTRNNFVYQTDHYLVDEMIDLGTGSYPIFYDYDKDGRKDLFVGSDGYFDRTTGAHYSRISYFRNTTTAKGIFSFELITDDFLSLSAKKWSGATLAIGDLDNDTLDDLVIGRTNGTLAFFKNHAGDNSVQPDWQLAIDSLVYTATGKLIDVGSNAAPCFYDINNDGKKDLVIGTASGNLIYIRNEATVSGAVSVEWRTDTLGGIKSKANDNNTVPYIGTTDNDGKNYLVLGGYSGRLMRYSGVGDGEGAVYKRIDSMYSYINVGTDGRSAPAFANLDNDTTGLHQLVVGNTLGGLYFYKQDYKADIKDVGITQQLGNIIVYPNPAQDILNVRWDNGNVDEQVHVRLVSVTGHVMFETQCNSQQQFLTTDISTLTPGVYYCMVQFATGRVIKPVTIIK